MKKIIVVGGAAEIMAESGRDGKRLRRIKFAGLTLAGVGVGKFRYLTAEEVAKLKGESV